LADIVNIMFKVFRILMTPSEFRDMGAVRIPLSLWMAIALSSDICYIRFFRELWANEDAGCHSWLRCRAICASAAFVIGCITFWVTIGMTHDFRNSLYTLLIQGVCLIFIGLDLKLDWAPIEPPVAETDSDSEVTVYFESPIHPPRHYPYGAPAYPPLPSGTQQPYFGGSPISVRQGESI
jgi:hypothetical protein